LPTAVRKRLRRTMKGLGVPQVLRTVRDSNRAAASNYVVRPYPGKATLFRAIEESLGSAEDVRAAWAGLVNSLEVHDVPGDHFAILVEPQVDQLAERLKACIDKASTQCEQARDAVRVS
jgi:thioesterase domain-containing protein